MVDRTDDIQKPSKFFNNFDMKIYIKKIIKNNYLNLNNKITLVN